MRRSSFLLLKQGMTSAPVRSKPALFGWRKTGSVESNNRLCACLFSSPVGGGGTELGQGAKGNDDNDSLTFAEVKKIMRLVNVGALKTKLTTEGKETICYSELLKACKSMGVTSSNDEAKEFIKALEEAGVVLIFRDKVYLHPDKMVDLVRRAAPLALTPEEDDSWREELRILEAKLEEIDMLAHRHVRRIFWAGLGLLSAKMGFFFRLTFWEFSWDVTGPIVFFVAASGIIINHVYSLFTWHDRTHRDLLNRLFFSRRTKLIKKRNFNMDRFMELQKKSKSSVFIF
ncbi:hypothetical protein L2E82_20388 [Cichorium intybus]|uniref:Uncharacterized protein n=1 Tax=Cichorium intybus TaxID=13427 RepID=A0ACB9DU02_CICIN|nr:hypothetical protein L2E82_20388 [Cichorium intybus]